MTERDSSQPVSPGRVLCFVGEQKLAYRDFVRLASGTGLAVRFSGDDADVADILGKSRPAAVVLPHNTPDRPALVSRLRERLAGEPLPILGWLPSAAPALADEAIWDGVDDYVIDGAAGHLAAILALVQRKETWEAVRAPVGTAILAHSDRTERIRLGQVLRASGFDLHFAAGAEDLGTALERVPHRVIVSMDVFRDGVAMDVLAERSPGKMTPTVIVAPGDRLDPLAAALGDRPWVRLLPAEADPAQATFLINDLLAPAAAEGWRTPRVLYGTMVSFRYPPAEDKHYGYTYNINLNGP
ncbi:MAG: hypothetical protein PHU25_17050, partial [Deltaproteobacteria bacterium]|nr:hypothetical protein [Deltaproteobacteria bacterium]